MKNATRAIIVALSLGAAAIFCSLAAGASRRERITPSCPATPSPGARRRRRSRPARKPPCLLGSPAKEGPFVLRLKFPSGFTVPPHRHSKDELVTVISGKFGIASGEKLDRAAAKPLPAGSFVHLPAGMPHYAWADGETIVQINGVGPFDVNYVDPKDDPRKK